MTDPLTGLADRWREEADTLREYGAERLATAAERHAEQLKRAHEAYRNEPLTPAEAAEETGYTADHIRRLIRDGKLPTAGDSSPVQVRRAHLPRKPGHAASGGRTRDGGPGSRTRVARTVVNSDQGDDDG